MDSRRKKDLALVTISLVTYNGARWLPGCLASIAAQDFSDFELLVLDNASTDGTVEMLNRWRAAGVPMRVQLSQRNLGFAAAHNIQIDAAGGDFVLLLNQDVELDAGFLTQAIAAFESRPRVASVQGRLLRLGGPAKRLRTIDSTGLVMFRSRRVISRSQGETDGPRHEIAGPVWGADGPAPVYRRSALLDVRVPATRGGWEVLDEDFFMYKEDVDLAWRLRRLGWDAWYEPAAIAWHARQAGTERGTGLIAMVRSHRHIPRWIKTLSWRNHRLMQVKNEVGSQFVADLPWIVARELASLSFIALADPLRLAAIPATIRAMAAARRKRTFLVRATARRRTRHTS